MASERNTPEEIVARLLPVWTCSLHKDQRWRTPSARSTSQLMLEFLDRRVFNEARQ